MQDFACRKTLAMAGAVARSLLNAYGSITILARQPKTMRVMKLTIVFIIAGLLQVQAKEGYSQQLTMDVKDESLIRVFSIIKKQTGYVYFGASELLAKARPVTIKVRNEPLENVLRLCFREQPLLDYVIDGKTISVFEKKKDPATTFSVSQLSYGAIIDVRGRVSNEENDPVAGVSVLVKGTKTGTSTDGDGMFTLNKVPSDAVLVLTAVNIQSVEAAVSGQRNLNLKVKGKTGKLDEVQVIAYGKTSQRFNVGNVATVKAEDIEKQPVTNPLLALQGRVPGLEVTQLTGMNGGGVTVRIQGRNSIQSGLEPLVVIDGVPFPTELTTSSMENLHLKGGSPLNYINPLDIESIDVLKDADATAIYGSRAANGAILITTKKGKIGRTKLGINVQQGWGQVTSKVDMMNTRQYLDMRYEAYQNDGIDWTRRSVTANDLKLWDTARYTDWQKTLIGGTAQYNTMSANISGGTAAIQYLIGATYNRQTTVYPGNFDNKRGAINFNISSTSANQKFRARLSGNYMYDQNRLPGVDLTAQAVLLHPNAPALHKADGTLNWAPNAAGSSTWNNPLTYTQNNDFTNTTKNLVSSANLSYNILPGLEIRSSFGYTQTQSDLLTSIRLEYYRPERRPTSQREARYSNRNMSSWIMEPQLQYTGRIGKVKIDGLLGTTVQQRSTNVLTLKGTGYSSDLLLKTFRAAQSISIQISDRTMYRYNALFGRLNINWADKYLVNFTARRDGSSRFGDKNKFHTFASVGAGWIFSQEKWLQRSLPFLSFGKLRASYGTTGNDQINDYSYLSLYYTPFAGIRYQNASNLEASGLSNPYLQWEQTQKWQGGIDLGFINDRILLNATYALNRSSNQLTPYTLPLITGFNNITQNFPATIQNTSWEFTLNTINVKEKDFNWSSSANLTIPRNKLVRFPNIEQTPYGSSYNDVIVGQPLGIVRVFQYAGVDPATGDYLVLDQDGKPTSNPDFGAARTHLISPLSKWYGGIQNSFTFKGFQVDILFQLVRTRGPKDMFYYNGEHAPGNFAVTGSNQPSTVMSRWQKPGDNANFARFTTGTDIMLWPQVSDVWYSHDASYIRLKNLSLSWQLPSNWTQKAHLQKARLYFQGQNLLTITKYTGLDPEVGGLGLPPLRLWTVGLQLEL